MFTPLNLKDIQLGPAPPAQLNVFDFLFNRGGIFPIPLALYAPCSMRHACYSTGALCALRSALCPLPSSPSASSPAYCGTLLKRSAPLAVCSLPHKAGP